jgi:hypothetical protein
MELVEKRMREGTASAQEVTHFLKIGSLSTKSEREILEKQKELLTAKTESIRSVKKIDELYKEAIEAIKTYSGNSDRIIREDDEYDD